MNEDDLELSVRACLSDEFTVQIDGTRATIGLPYATKETTEVDLSDCAFEGARAGTRLASQRLASVLESGPSKMTTIFIKET